MYNFKSHGHGGDPENQKRKSPPTSTSDITNEMKEEEKGEDEGKRGRAVGVRLGS